MQRNDFALDDRVHEVGAANARTLCLRHRPLLAPSGVERPERMDRSTTPYLPPAVQAVLPLSGDLKPPTNVCDLCLHSSCPQLVSSSRRSWWQVANPWGVEVPMRAFLERDGSVVVTQCRPPNLPAGSEIVQVMHAACCLCTTPLPACACCAETRSWKVSASVSLSAPLRMAQHKNEKSKRTSSLLVVTSPLMRKKKKHKINFVVDMAAGERRARTSVQYGGFDSRRATCVL